MTGGSYTNLQPIGGVAKDFILPFLAILFSKNGVSACLITVSDVFFILLIVSLTNSKLRAVVSMSAGLLAAVLLIGMMIQMNHELNGSISGKKGEPDYSGAIGMFVKVNYTIWYYMAVVIFVVAAFFGFKHHKIEEKDALDRVIDFEFQRQKESEP